MIGFLADAYHRTGQYPMAMASLEGGLAIAMTTGQSQWDAELHRLKGEFLLHGDGDEGDVEQLFTKALDLARGAGAVSLELRAAMSLGRLRQRQGKPEQVVELVAPLLESFTEGLDCPDLVEARALVHG